MQYGVIINPAAQHGKARLRIKDIEQYLRGQQKPFKIYITKGTGHARECAREAVKKGCRRIIAAGGDGLVNEIAGVLINKTVSLGVVPIGTGNDFARTLKMPMQLHDALSYAITKPDRLIDTGICNNQVFINCIGIGYDGMVAHELYRRRIQGKRTISYLPIVLSTLRAYNESLVTCIVDGKKSSELLFLCSIGNGKFAGGGFKLTPEAEIDDGHLDICLMRAMPQSKRLPAVMKTMRGKHGILSAVSFYTAKSITLISDTPIPAHFDGEIMKHTKYVIKIRPRSLRVVSC